MAYVPKLFELHIVAACLLFYRQILVMYTERPSLHKKLLPPPNLKAKTDPADLLI